MGRGDPNIATVAPLVESEESLSSALERQMNGFNDVQQQVNSFMNDLQKLKTQCDALKIERTTLAQDCAARDLDRLALNNELEGLRVQREALESELSELQEDKRWLQSVEDMPPEDLDIYGRVKRQLWLQTEKVAALQLQISEISAGHNRQLDSERAISIGLRDRIGRLERQLRETQQLSEAKPVEPALPISYELEVSRAEAAKLKIENDDIRRTLAKESKAHAASTSRVATLESELRLVKEDLVRCQEDLRVSAASNALTSNKQRDINELPLQAIPVNVAIPHTPPRLPVRPSAGSSTSGASRTTDALSPSTSIAKRFAHLERQHESLKKAYKKVRARHASDIKHWKEYRAVEEERRAIKQRRREERAAAESAARSSSSIAPDDGPMSFAGTPTQQAAQSCIPRPAPAAVDTPKPARENTGLNDVPEDDATRTPKQWSTHTPIQHTDTPGRLSRQPSRVTPWLGASRSTPVTQAKSFCSDSDEDHDDGHRNTTPAQARTPLVRDRTGLSMGDGSLRRAALQRTSNKNLLGDRSILSEFTTPGPVNGKRPLDLEGMSPAERASERKKLSRLSTAERRAIYAPYKGKGRYIAPEDVQRTVADEFEVDPARNNGVAHQYHDTVRNREERRRMHGGDCECCRDYYAAIGPLPRFNTGLVWKDGGDAQDGQRSAHEPADHQQRISRHRETWRKPPTPPDFWKIGFPTTQDVADVNAKADQMVAEREMQIRREAAHKESKWRKKS